jgi:hypothetical protein
VSCHIAVITTTVDETVTEEQVSAYVYVAVLGNLFNPFRINPEYTCVHLVCLVG